MTINVDLFEHFLISMEITTPRFRRNISRFLKWCEDERVDYTNENTIDDTIRRYYIYMNACRLTNETLTETYDNLLNFYYYLRVREVITWSYKTKFAKYAYEKNRIYTVVTESEVETLIGRLGHHFDWHPLKLSSIIYTIFYGGVTNTEFNNLLRHHFSWDDSGICSMKIMISQRTADRVIKFDARVSDIIRKYFILEPPEYDGTNAFNLRITAFSQLFRTMAEVSDHDKRINWDTLTGSYSFIKDFVKET